MRQARQRLRALGRRHVGQEPEWRCVVRSGTGSRQILKAAEEFRVDLVVMPRRGLSHAPPNRRGEHFGASSKACGLSSARVTKTNTPKTTQELIKSNL